MIKLLQTEEDFAVLLPAVLEFCAESTDARVSDAVIEQCKALYGDGSLTVMDVEDGVVRAYITGSCIPRRNVVFVTQAYSKGGRKLSQEVLTAFEQYIRPRASVIEFVSDLPVRLFEGYGFKTKAQVMVKHLDT